MYRLVTEDGTISHKLFTLDDAKWEVKVSKAYKAVVTPRSHKVIYSK